MSVILGYVVALINPRVQWQSDKDTWFQTQANISLPLFNQRKISILNDTTTLMKNNAKITGTSYESPRNERRGRDEQDKNVSVKEKNG